MSEYHSGEIERMAQRLSEGWAVSADERTTVITMLVGYSKLRKAEETDGLICFYKRVINKLSLLLADMTSVEKNKDKRILMFLGETVAAIECEPEWMRSGKHLLLLRQINKIIDNVKGVTRD